MKRRKKLNWVLVLFMLAGLGVGFYSAQRPWQVYRDQKAKSTALQNELNTLRESQLKHLSKKSKNTNAVKMEEEARKNGFVAPGEVPLK